MPKVEYRTLTTEEAEVKMKEREKAGGASDRWLMRDLENGGSSQGKDKKVYLNIVSVFLMVVSRYALIHFRYSI